MTMIETPLQSIDSYIAYFSQTELPVLRKTVRALAELAADEDKVSGRQVAAVVLQDPLMTLRVLVHIEATRRSAQNHDITTIERAIMMLGITPFFRKFSNLPCVEDKLQAHPQALLGVVKVINRARNASSWARDWAIIRHDLDVDEVTVGALLHDAAEVLCWCFAPALMLRVKAEQKRTPGLRSATAQQAVLGVTMHDLQLALVKAWRLPELLITLMDDDHANNPRVRNVVLANNLARHSANGWNDPALPDDFTAIGDLIHMGREQLLHRLDVPKDALTEHPVPATPNPAQQQQAAAPAPDFIPLPDTRS
ncbi:MAG: HDOD domain-containing protein [Rhodocyclaceae bacterium]